MVKFLRLLQNENKKEMKKISTKIFMLTAVFSIILAILFVMLMKWLSYIGLDATQSYWKEYVQSDIDIAKANLATAKQENDEQGILNLETQIKIYEYAIDNEINLYSANQNWKAEALYKLLDEESQKNFYKILGNTENFNKKNNLVNNIYDVIEKDDFNGYIKIEKDILKNDLDEKNILQDEYDSRLEILNIKEEYEIGKSDNEDDMWKVEVLSEIENLKQELKSNLNSYTRKILNFEQRQEKENTIKIDLYRLENNIAPISSFVGNTNYRNYFDLMSESFSMVVIAILIIMIAGSTISTEYSKGTIKFLTMTPYKRWKILLSKLVNAVIIMLVLTIAISLISIIVGNIFFAKYEAGPYLYVQNGEVHELNHTVYTILRFLCDDIDIFVYLLFALMLSVITRNTAASIGVSVATYLGSGIGMTIINTFVKADWVKFIPFNNLGLTDKIFTNTTSLMTSQISSMQNNVSIVFSLSVLAVTSILMIVTMFDSFNKRDIK